MGFLAGGLAVEAFEGGARGQRPLLGHRKFATGGAQGFLKPGETSGGEAERAAGGLDLGVQNLDLAFHLDQPGLLFQADGGGLGRIGPSGEPVPPPEIALLRNQSAARGEPGLQPVAVGPVDHGGEGDAGGERGGRLYKSGERRCAGGPRRRPRVTAAPKRRGRSVQRGLQVVANGGGQRPLIAAMG